MSKYTAHVTEGYYKKESLPEIWQDYKSRWPMHHAVAMMRDAIRSRSEGSKRIF